MNVVHFTLADGERQDVKALEGESIMRAATQNGVPGIEGECGGDMTCATCHVYVSSPWKERLRPQSHDEIDLLSEDERLTEDSRLACQIKMTPELDGIKATVVNEA
jgi:2Fe-2S ferredoxin